MGSFVSRSAATTVKKVNLSIMPNAVTPLLLFPYHQRTEFRLTGQQIRLLRSTIPTDIEGLYELGKGLVAAIFEIAPEAKPIFDRVFQAKLRDEPYQAALDRFYLHFIKSLLSCIPNIMGTDQMSAETHLFQIGRKHQELRPHNFKATDFDAFADGIKMVMTERLENMANLTPIQVEETLVAWGLLANHMIASLKRGFESV